MPRASASSARGAVADRVCLYALVDHGGPSPLRLTGLSTERLRIVTIDGIEAVIGTLPRAPKPGMAALRRYDEVQRALMARYSSVLPARFGTCASTLDELALSVRDRRAHIRHNLRLVRRRAQMTIRMFTGSESSTNRFRVDPEPVQSRLRTGSEYGDGATQGTQYLRRRVGEMEIPGAGRLRPAVERWVRAERSERRAHGRLAGTMYHLIPRSAVPAYRRALARAAREAEVTVIVSGPWPPYAFAES
jgi:hypothetical protein